MAKKPFYSMQEVCEKLGKTEDDIKNLVRAGELREFRDAGKVFFKSEDIDKLAAPGPSSADSGEILLEPVADLEELDAGGSGSGELPSLVESSGGTSIIGLEPLGDEDESDKKKGKKEDTAITAAGIGVFDDDELEIDADPMAKTQITTGTSESDQISLEGAGSGSGLLDLAREADDTALGADLLDEIYPGEEDAARAVEQAEPEPVAAEPVAAAPVEEEAPEEEFAGPEAGVAITPVILPTSADPAEGMFSGLLISCVVLMAVALTVLAGAAQGFLPDYGRFLATTPTFYLYLGGSVALALIAVLAGWFIGKAFAPRRR